MPSSITYPQLPLDGLLRRAAERDPDGCALRTEAGAVSFAELDALADRFAACAARLAGGPGARIGVGNALGREFPAAYYGAVRSGNTAVLVNPLIKEAGLLHVFAAAGIEVAFVPAATAELLAGLRDRLPALRAVVALDELPAEPAGTPPGGFPVADLDADACVQFTTGTTGRPRGVRLTHRNLVANAAQTAAAHRLGDGSVTLNHLPLFHTMHLNSAVFAGATQVLCTDPDPLASLALAARTGATHYYGLPARLHRLAGQLAQAGPGTEGVPAGAALTAVLSGGTALAPATAGALADRLGVPVVQGYGMAELSPLAHCQSPDGGPAGSVGRAVPGTECRIVDLDGRQPLGAHTTGEVQVRGPQLMAGYLDGDEDTGIDAEGWLSTGDIGHLDADGELFLVDRIGDVFKYDNELVSPTAVESVLAEDPRVADCVVTGWPDPVHGAVTWAGIVLREPYEPRLLDTLDSIVDGANRRLARFERIRRVEVVDAVPRTPVGKPERRRLRQALQGLAAVEAAA
ncbi:acyl--CoA ligase (plasmid) [Streptomyces sp. NBC_01351]|uniref:class I adenylate-forming enzyme family protein n=1 Tax=Streptomyces sp. NBC_01351 TaxID=2903833 RepID=UPI002E31A217|nr:class I adenylate-forming enzyme family protein [Streptomyces sp. NBC_01351]